MAAIGPYGIAILAVIIFVALIWAYLKDMFGLGDSSRQANTGPNPDDISASCLIIDKKVTGGLDQIADNYGGRVTEVEWEITFKPQQGKVFVYESGCKDTLMHACNASATSDGCISGTWPAEGSLQKAVCEGENGLEKQLADKDNKFDSDIVVKVKMSLPAQHAADKSGKDAKTGKETKYGYYIRNTVTIKGHCDDNEKTKAKATEDDKKSREYSGSGKVCVGKCSSCTRDGMVELARQMAIDNPKYYQLPLRNRKGYYDCSSFVYHALKDGCGVDLNNANCTYNTDCNPPTTYDMPKEFGKKLKEITIDQLQPGDILWKYGHTELYIGGYQSIGAHTNTRPNNQVGVTGSGKDNITRFHRFFTLEEYD